MSFGRNKNIVRRAVRPDHGYHRAKRRRRLDHPLALSNAFGLGSVLRGFLALVGLRRRR